MPGQRDERVLIVGAGPTGLILAHELLRRGIPVRQIERRNGPSHTTRAFTLHARTMEMFEHMGVAHRLEDVCLPCPGNVFHFQGLADADKPRLDFRTLPTRYAFYYKLNQNDFEQVLREHLFSSYGHAPEYGTEAQTVEGREDGAVVRIRNGKTDEVSEVDYPWVVGCDGAHSAVRQSAGIPFSGEQVGVMAMMDAELAGFPYDDAWVNYFIGTELFMLVTKLPGRFWRVYLSDAGKMTEADDPQASFQTVADALGIGMRIKDPHWATQWSILNNIAETYRQGHILLCGDASHVHSPAGGQGMNGCMQDAFNLGWKLAQVIAGRAPDTCLDTYEAERKPIGQQVTLGAKATHDIVMAFGKNLGDRIALTRTPEWHDNAVRLISGLAHNYRDVVEVPGGLRPVGGPQAGERPPDAVLRQEPQRRIYDLLRHPRFTLLVLPGHDHAGDASAGAELVDAIERRYPGQVLAQLISPQPHPAFDFDHWVSDESGEFRAAYGLNGEGRLVLIRPDLYVDLNCDMADVGAVLPHLGRWFTA